MAGHPPALLADVLRLLPQYVGLVTQECIRDEVPSAVLRALLSHEDDHVASEAAIWVWHGRKGHIDEAMKPLWREALLRSDAENSGVGDILSADGDLACAWLKRCVETADWRMLMLDHVIREAARPLTEDQRVELLLAVGEPSRFRHLAVPLLGSSARVFARVLTAGGRESLCLALLEQPKGEVWAECIMEAHKHGIGVDHLAWASNLMSGFSSSEAAYLQERIDEVAQFLDDPRGPVRDVARRMTELLAASRERALIDEREERVWGW